MRAKKYSHQADILADIRKANNLKAKLIAEAQDWDRKADERFKAGDSFNGKEWREKAKKLHAQASRIENVRLKQLKLTLAAFQTRTFEFMGGDDAVRRQNIV